MLPPPFPPAFSSPLINKDLLAGPQHVFTLNNRFFRHQACYSLLPARPGGQADRIVGLYKYKVVEGDLLGGHRSTPLRHKHMLFPGACITPLITEDLPELRDRIRPFPLMHGQNWFLITFHPLSKAKETHF
jgi:hypothetical protein